MQDRAARRAELERYLTRSRTVQRRMRWIGAVGIALGLLLLAGGAGTTVGMGLAALAAVVAGAGLWITWGHITDFEKQLAGLTGSRRAGAAVDVGRRRRRQLGEPAADDVDREAVGDQM